MKLRDVARRTSRAYQSRSCRARARDAFERIGTDTCEVLERRPAATVVVALSYPRFVRKDRDRRHPTQILVGDTV